MYCLLQASEEESSQLWYWSACTHQLPVQKPQICPLCITVDFQKLSHTGWGADSGFTTPEGQTSCIPEPLMEKHGEGLVSLEDILHFLHFFPSSGLPIHDNSSRKCKLGRGWWLNFSSCYSTTAYPLSLNISWGDSKTKLLPGNDSVPPVSKAAAQCSITQQPQAVGATCENKARTVSLPYSHSFHVGRSG